MFGSELDVKKMNQSILNSRFDAAIPGKACRLRKDLYGLRQAPRCWYAKDAAALSRYGFEQCNVPLIILSFPWFGEILGYMCWFMRTIFLFGGMMGMRFDASNLIYISLFI